MGSVLGIGMFGVIWGSCLDDSGLLGAGVMGKDSGNMKRLFFSLVFVICLSIPSRGELPPSAYEKMQSEAADVLRINVLRIERRPTETPTVTDVNMVAEVLKVGRSKSGIKPGDVITISYQVTDHPPGWSGPGEVPVPREADETVAFLKPLAGTPDYLPAAGAMSFSEF